MFKKIVIFLSFTLLSFLPYAPAVAADYGVGAFSEAAGYSTDRRDVYAIIDTVISVFLSMSAIILFLLLFYGGFTWIKSQGRDEEVLKAKQIIEGAGIGIAIVLASYGITYFVFNKLLGS